MVAVLSSVLASVLAFSLHLQPATRPLLPGARMAEPPKMVTSLGLPELRGICPGSKCLPAARAATPVMQNEFREFNKMDKDGGGTIDFEEFAAMQLQQKDNVLTREELKVLFDRFDADGGGEIDLQEYIQAKGALGTGKKTVPLTGDTLQAGLKMRCDMSGASYAIYWANQNGQLKVVDSYKSASYKRELAGRGVTESFADASKPFALNAKGSGPIARVLENGDPILIKNVGESDLARRCSFTFLPFPPHALTFPPCSLYAMSHAPWPLARPLSKTLQLTAPR